MAIRKKVVPSHDLGFRPPILQGVVSVGFVLLVLSCPTTFVRAKTFSVVDFGAVGDGRTDNTRPFRRAWNAACSDTHGRPTFLVPSPGTFLLPRHIIFSGPCKSSAMLFQVDGDIVASKGLWTKDVTSSWINFRYINGLSIYGTGKIDGRGSDWWACKTSRRCSTTPDSVGVAFCDGFRLSGVTFSNSASKHLTVFASQWVAIDGITVTSPQDSPNTDGVLIQQCKHVSVTSSTFSTGDDCVAIGTGTSDVNISRITCGPGHGISIGSLGGQGSRAEVENVHVTSCKFYNTLCGVRIKTWPGGSGFAREISFEDITFKSVKYPVIIDQYYYCGGSDCQSKSAVEVSNVRFVRLKGTTVSDKAIRLECSKSVPCRGIMLDNVVIWPDVRGKKTSSSCYNVRGWKKGPVIPAVTCLA